MNATGDNVIEVFELTKIFRDFWRRPKVIAVNNLTMSIPRGKVFGLLGPNGSGKSTTIKILLGLLKPTSGTVKVLGKSPSDVNTKKEIGYLPEESYLYNYLTPKETLDFYGRLFNMDTAKRKERIAQLLEMTGLSHAANRPVGEFSKGMARRIGLSQALINDPELVILDEPTSGLDPVGCRQVKDLIRTLAKRGKTVILSSHLLADVEDVCDHVTILFNGKIQATGRINDLLEEHDRISITVPIMPPDKTKELLAAVREISKSEPDMSTPSINLEQFFLKIVKEAHADSINQSGVTTSEGLAEYLHSGEKKNG